MPTPTIVPIIRRESGWSCNQSTTGYSMKEEWLVEYPYTSETTPTTLAIDFEAIRENLTILPDVGDYYEDDLGTTHYNLQVTSLSWKRLDAYAMAFIVSVGYAKPNYQVAGQEQIDPDDPETVEVIVKSVNYSTSTYETITEKGRTLIDTEENYPSRRLWLQSRPEYGDPSDNIVNGAGDLVLGVTKEVHRTVISCKGIEFGLFDPNALADLIGSVNKNTTTLFGITIPPWCGKLLSIDVTLQNLQDTEWKYPTNKYYEIDYKIEVDLDTYQRAFLNAGLNHLYEVPIPESLYTKVVKGPITTKEVFIASLGSDYDPDEAETLAKTLSNGEDYETEPQLLDGTGFLKYPDGITWEVLVLTELVTDWESSLLGLYRLNEQYVKNLNPTPDD